MPVLEYVDFQCILDLSGCTLYIADLDSGAIENAKIDGNLVVPRNRLVHYG